MARFGKWLKDFKKNIEVKSQVATDKRVATKYKTGGLAHQCMECKWLTYRTEKPRNWVCRCPDERMRFMGNTCLGWQLGSHPEMVVISSR
jgi:hypothetical protein